jgi:transposase
MSQAAAARAVGVHRRTVTVWCRRYRYRERGGEGVLGGRRVSPRRGKGPLTGDEARQVRGRIADGTPDQLELPSGPWTSRAVRELTERRFGRRLGLSTVQPDLRRRGMTPQKPLTRAKGRQPAAIAAWLERDHPAIAKRAKAEPATICRGDGTGIPNQDQTGRSCAPGGETPVGARTAGRITQSPIAAVSSRGLMRFMLYGGALDVERFLAFLRRLVRDARRKLFPIVDDLKVHHAKKVAARVASHSHGIALFHRPACAPEHNPDGYLNDDPKQELRPKPRPAAKEELTKSARFRAARDPALAPALAPARAGLLQARARPLRRLKRPV